MIVANALLVALAVSALEPAPRSLPEPPGEVGHWSAADRREFMDTCRLLKAGEDACACFLAVLERHAASLDEYRENHEQAREDAMDREGLRCERLSILPERRQGDGH